MVWALFRLENSHNPELLLEVLTKLLAWLGSESQDSLRRAFTVWFSRILFPSRFEAENLPVMENLYEVKTMLAERMEEWKENYRQEGRQAGAAQLLMCMLEMKFGKLSVDIKAKLNQADEGQIFLWSERILTAETLGEMFGH